MLTQKWIRDLVSENTSTIHSNSAKKYFKVRWRIDRWREQLTNLAFSSPLETISPSSNILHFHSV